jgi:hypothetical protein
MPQAAGGIVEMAAVAFGVDHEQAGGADDQVVGEPPGIALDAGVEAAATLVTRSVAVWGGCWPCDRWCLLTRRLAAAIPSDA